MRWLELERLFPSINRSSEMKFASQMKTRKFYVAFDLNVTRPNWSINFK